MTFCDVNVREQGGHIVHYTMQCVLAVNMFHEKIYIFVWFWLVLLAFLNVANIFYWAVLSFDKSCSERFVKQHLAVINLLLYLKKTKIEQNMISNFIHYFMKIFYNFIKI